MVSLSLSYKGLLADNNVLDMYDAARGLAGFHRSLALTTHLVLNGEIITQAPSLKGAQIISATPEEGSWKVTAVILAGIWAAATASKDTVAGHLLFSTYDYVVRSSLGFPVDFDKTLVKSHEEYLKEKKITPEKLDSLIEKVETSVADMHRPIVGSKTANRALLTAYPEWGASHQIGPDLTQQSYDYLSKAVLEDDPTIIRGVVSNFNINTAKGRIFVLDEKRPIPFELSDEVQDRASKVAIANSLRANARSRELQAAEIAVKGRRLVTVNGRLKAIRVNEIVDPPA